MQRGHDLPPALSPQPPPARGGRICPFPWIERYLASATVGLFVLSVLVGDGFVGWAPGLILLDIRLPRTLLAILVGAGVGAVFLLSFAGRAPSGPSVILAGIAVSAISAALLALALALAPNPFALAEITFWLLGGLQDRTLLHVGLAAPPILLGAAVLLRLGRGLDALSLGEDAAASLGVPVGRTLRLAALGTALAAGASAAVAGGIGFVGLVVPNLLRPLVGEQPGALLVPSALAGAALLLAADLLVRLSVFVLPLSGPLPLGVLTALLGAPCLVAIARRAAP